MKNQSGLEMLCECFRNNIPVEQAYKQCYVGISYALTVYRILEVFTGAKKDLKEEILKMYHDGLDYEDISKFYPQSKKYIKKILKAERIRLANEYKDFRDKHK